MTFSKHWCRTKKPDNASVIVDGQEAFGLAKEKGRVSSKRVAEKVEEKVEKKNGWRRSAERTASCAA